MHCTHARCPGTANTFHMGYFCFEYGKTMSVEMKEYAGIVCLNTALSKDTLATNRHFLRKLFSSS